MNWLRFSREKVGIRTQDELATLLQLEGINVTRATVSHWENGRNNPPLENPDFRRVMSKLLKVSRADLLTMAGYEVARTDHTRAAQRAADILDQLDEDTQENVLKMLEALL